jgi:hypothetical protein
VTTSGNTVDNEREEHRMLIRINDSSPTLAKLIIGEVHGEIKNKEGILKQKVHEKPYTITLYALLDDYGMTPISRIKPRVRFNRKGYDDVASGSPVHFSLDDTVDLVEFKHAVPNAEVVDISILQKIFFDGPVQKRIEDDDAAWLIAQHDVLLMKPPVKTKSKITSFETIRAGTKNGIPIGEFLEALNNPKKAERIFQRYKGGKGFAGDLLRELEPYTGLDFRFGIYSRYRRWDCVYKSHIDKEVQPYRTTFDPFTVLGWIRTNSHGELLQPLEQEKLVRWEHKISPSLISKRSLDDIARSIREIRSKYLVPRTLSKSQTALTMLKEWKESHLSLMDELGFGITTEIELKAKKVNDIQDRKALRNAFERGHKYILNPENKDIVENHKNLAFGIRGELEYVSDGVQFYVRQRSKKVFLEDRTIIFQPRYHKETQLSADDLRSEIPRQGFESCHSKQVDECGYTILSNRSGRGYTVSYGRRTKGSVNSDGIDIGKPKDYLSIKYLGSKPEKFKGHLTGKSVPIKLDEMERIQKEIIEEMRHIAEYLKERRVI